MSELYSFDKYKGCRIYIEQDVWNYPFFGSVYHNGICWGTVKGLTASSCLQDCKDMVDEMIELEKRDE